jgi:molybdopterin-guanine dinucleotide biosynthesis protein A
MISAAILAGGRAVRFGGRDKGSLSIDGRTIFDRQIGELSQVAEEILLVGDAVPRSGVRAVADLVPGCGPLGGVHTALTEARGDVTLVVGCDMPFVTASFLAHLASLCQHTDAVVPQTEGGYHPLCAAYSRGCLEPVARRLAAGLLKMTDLFADVRVRVVTLKEVAVFGDPGQLLANVNSPADYNRIEALHSQEL